MQNTSPSPEPDNQSSSPTLETIPERLKTLRVLHVTECITAGVWHAINSHKNVLPELEHHLAWCGGPEPTLSGWYSTRYLGDNHIKRIRTLREHVDALAPDVIHAHSSWAGLYARLRPTPVPVVYEPHCFKFDDPTCSSMARSIFRFAEHTLTPNTEVFATLSPHESMLVRSITKRPQIVEVPNIPVLPLSSSRTTTKISGVTMIGRLCTQKDPQFFVKAVEASRRMGVDIPATWIGSGDAHYESILHNAGIKVTGWITPEQIQDTLQDTIYLHTALYEGFPLSILDAASVDTPIIARRIPALADSRLVLVSTPEEMATKIINLLSDDEALARTRSINSALLEQHSPSRQRSALINVYLKATSSNSTTFSPTT